MLNKKILAVFALCIFSLKVSFSSNYGVAEMQGRRRSMEDAHCAILSGDHAFYGVFDGHGGSLVSKYISENLYNNIATNEKFSTDKKQAIIDGFELSNNNLDKTKYRHQGSVAITALIDKYKIYIANLGDSRAVVSQNKFAIPLSIDHKPSRPDELQRVTDLGGYIRHYGVWRVMGRLAVSRAFGDFGLHPYVVSTPEINTYKRSRGDQFLILACDGVWDVISNQQAVDIVNESLLKKRNLNLAAHDLINAAYDAGSTDNISAMIISLR